jgi:hypothetical protein
MMGTLIQYVARDGYAWRDVYAPHYLNRVLRMRNPALDRGGQKLNLVCHVSATRPDPTRDRAQPAPTHEWRA